jgi:hypothetical protein
MFDMNQVNAIINLDILSAQKAALEIVKASTATPRNKFKAEQAIRNSRSSRSVAMTMSNFILAHPSNGLKVIGA